MKRLLSILALTLIAVSVYAGGSAEQSEQSQSQSTQVTDEWSWAAAAEPYRGETVHVLLPTHPATDATSNYISEFEEATGINVDLELLQRRAMNTRQEMELSSRSGAYDVTHIAPPKRVRYVKAQWATPLDQYISDERLTSPDFNSEDFLEQYVDMLTVDGTVYGLPFSGETNLLYYRTDILEQYGISAPPDTISDLERVAAEVHTEDVPAFVSRAVQGQGINVFTWSTFLYSYGGRFFDEDMRPVFQNAAGVEATEKYAQLLQDYGPFGVSGYTHYEAVTDFSQGKVALFFGAGPWGASTFGDPSKSTVVGRWAAARVPEGPAGRFSDAYTHGLMIPSNAENKEAAWLFIQWFTSRETQLNRALMDGGSGDVTRRSVFENAEYKEKYSAGNWATAQLDAVANYGQELRPNGLPEWLEVGDRIGAAVQQVIAGERSARDALNAAAEDVTAIMADAGYYD